MALAVVMGLIHVTPSWSYIGPITSTVGDVLVPLFDQVAVGWEPFFAGFEDLRPFVVASVFVNALGIIACVLLLVFLMYLFVKEARAAEQEEA